MFKTTLTATATATAFALIAGLASAAQPPLSLNLDAVTATAQTFEGAAQLHQVNYYCEWVTLYDVWGNWVTVWQCF